MSRAVDQDDDARSLIEASPERLASALGRREAVAGALFAGGFLAAAIALAILAPGAREVSPAVLVVLLAAFVVASRVEFEVGSGCAVPTQLDFVPLLFALPVGLGHPTIRFFARGQASLLAVSFRFAAQGATWDLDDVYLGPFKAR